MRKIGFEKFNQQIERNWHLHSHGVVRKLGCFRSCDKRWQKLDFCIRSQNATAESGVEHTRRTLNEESTDVQVANESHDFHILQLSQYNFETTVTMRANYHCCIQYRGVQDVGASDSEKMATVVGQQQLAAAPRQRASTIGDRDSVVFGENIHHCVGTLCLFSQFSIE